MARPQLYADNYQTTLATAGIPSGSSGDVVTFSVMDAPPSALTGGGQFDVIIDLEYFLVTAVSGAGNKTWTATRGRYGSSSPAHTVGVPVVHLITAEGFDVAYARVGTDGTVGGPSPGSGPAASPLASSVVSDSSRPGSQNEGLVWDGLTGKWTADAGVYSVRGDRAISVTNAAPDPRGTTSANFQAAASGSGSISETPTQRTDGYQQLASPMSCQEIIGTPDPGGAGYIQFFTRFHTTSNTIFVNPSVPMVAARMACKLSGSIGSAWNAQLNLAYYTAGGSFLASNVIASAGLSSASTGNWFVLEGFDSQMLFDTAYVELSVSVYGTTVAQPLTLRCTEFAIVLDPEGDVPGYVGGDAFNGVWLGTTDASQSTVQFDPLAAYSSKWFGTNEGGSTPGVARATIAQGLAMLRAVGATTERVGVNFTGGNPAAPATPAATVTWLQSLIGAGIKPILNVYGFPEWMAPTHFGITQAGNGGSISNSATSMNVTGSLPANLTLPATFQWNDSSTEVATITALSTGVATITRGTGATSHNDGITLLDAQFGAGGHVYYPDSGYRTTYATAITNLIATLGAANIFAVQLWNEPNLAVDDTRNEGAAGYSALLNVVYAAVKAAAPSVKILGGVLAVQSNTGAGVTIAETFLGGMFTASAEYDYLDCHFYPSGTGTVGTSAPGTGITGFDQSIKRIKDKLLAESSSATQMFVSEMGMYANQPDERRQAQTVALCLGRLLRDPQMVGACNNGLASPAVGGAVGYGLFDSTAQRPRQSAHQVALMLGAPKIPVGKNDPVLVDALMPWTIPFVPLLGHEDSIVVQGTWGLNLSASYALGCVLFNTTQAQYDEVAWDFALAAGSWTLSMLYTTISSGGQCSVCLDSAPQGSVIDTYSAAETYNQQAKVSFTVTRSGRHRISLRMAAKNASSSAYEMLLQMFQLRRTA